MPLEVEGRCIREQVPKFTHHIKVDILLNKL